MDLPTDGCEFTGEVLVRVRALSKAYGTQRALNGIDFEVQSGRVLGLLGPNGAGKTTTLGCITNLIVPDDGTIEWPLWQGTLSPGAVGYASQEIGLFPSLTVDQNLFFFAGLTGLTKHGREKAVVDIAESLGFDHHRNRRVRDLSIGQQRVVHVAASAVNRPPLLLLDEPTAGLDIHARRRVLDHLVSQAKRGIAVLLSSHNMDEVERIADDVVVIDHGEMVAAGSMTEVLNSAGGSVVELDVGGDILRFPGSDIAAALDAYAHLGSVTQARVVTPSLESVFEAMTAQQRVSDDLE